MIDGVRLKVCGLTSLVDADFADRCGADYLGFVLYPKSPRHLSVAQYRAMAPRLPDRRKVAVMVEPAPAELAALRDDFDFFQIHFRADLPEATITAWSEAVGADKLWLAPKLPPGAGVPGGWIDLARYFLLDTFHAEGFGGSGKTGDWDKFVRLRTAHPDRFWILAGGLNPENIRDAVVATNTAFVDVNSGVEAAPGVKDHEKLKRFVVKLHEAKTTTKS